MLFVFLNVVFLSERRDLAVKDTAGGGLWDASGQAVVMRAVRNAASGMQAAPGLCQH